MTTMEKSLALFSGSVNPELAEEIAKELGVNLGNVKLEQFSNGEIYKTEHNGMATINHGFHSQVAAPGYAMCYAWAIRHLDGDPWQKTRIDDPEHSWLWKPDANDHIFQGN